MLRALCCLFFFLNVAIADAAPRVRAPKQPTTGLGSSEAFHRAVVQRKFGSGEQGYYLFEPADPAPASAPVVVFCHGYLGGNPKNYGKWISHLVKRGNIVVFPVYQRGPLRVRDYTENAAVGVAAAIEELNRGSHVRPQLDKVAYFGHSLGGVLAANLGAIASVRGLPLPKVLFVVHPGDVTSAFPRLFSILRSDLYRMPTEMLFLGVTGADDRLVARDTALNIYSLLVQIPAANRELLEFRSDSHGRPKLKSNHLAPQARVSNDALDYFGYWKLGDALLNAAFYQGDRDSALGGTSAQLYLGTWSDGVAVLPAVRYRP